MPENILPPPHFPQWRRQQLQQRFLQRLQRCFSDCSYSCTPCVQSIRSMTLTPCIAGEESEEEVGGGDERQRGSAVCRQVPQVEDGTEGRVVAVCDADRRSVAVDVVVRPRSSPGESAGFRRSRDARTARQVCHTRARGRTTAPTCSIRRFHTLCCRYVISRTNKAQQLRNGRRLIVVQNKVVKT